jgi:serine/threonine-protein kinase
MFSSGDQIGPYTLIRKLGRGAFGTVWLSERRTAIATTTAALKIPLNDEVNLGAIRQEANLWVRASGHPNVLPIIEANIYAGQAIIASEYASDGSLEALLNQHGGKALSLEISVEIISGILAGLEHLHTRGIIHRDLKPANILFQESTPRLADFGISSVLLSNNRSNIVAGTPSYMAPEAFDGIYSEQTDIWSVGVIFYNLLTGHLPFASDNIAQLINMIVRHTPAPLSPSTPRLLQEIITRAISKEPTERYKSAAEMRAAIHEVTKVTWAKNRGEAERKFRSCALFFASKIAETFYQKHKINLDADRIAWQRLVEQAEEVLLCLIYFSESKIVLPFISTNSAGPIHFEENITRDMFQEFIKEFDTKFNGLYSFGDIKANLVVPHYLIEKQFKYEEEYRKIERT